jgi:hypothetical protein
VSYVTEGESERSNQRLVDRGREKGEERREKVGASAGRDQESVERREPRHLPMQRTVIDDEAKVCGDERGGQVGT